MLKSVKSIKKAFYKYKGFYYIYKCFYIVKMGAAGFVKIYVKRMAYIKYFNFVFFVRLPGLWVSVLFAGVLSVSDGFGAVFSGVADGAGLTA